MTPMSETSAFEKLVDISVRQTEILTEQTMLLRDLKERFIDVREAHEKSAEDTRTLFKSTLTDTIGKSDLWWRRAIMVIGGLIIVLQVIGDGDRLGALLRLFGLGK